MKKTSVFLALLAVCAAAMVFVPAAGAAGAAQEQAAGAVTLPGSEVWQPYLAQSPVNAQSFAQDPLAALRSLLPDTPAQTLRACARRYTDVLLFLLLASLLSFLLEGTPNGGLLDLAAVGGCGVLLWGDMTQLAQTLCEKIAGWQSFLLGFLPVYAGVLAAGGETAASGSVTGLLLTGLCLLAQALGAWLAPLLECYLALSIACCITEQAGLAAACSLAGKMLRQGIGFAGKAFVFLLGVQRVFTYQFDRSTVRMGRLLTSTVPVIGQTLSDATEVVLAGVQTLKSGLGFAALAVLGAEFVPVYFELLVQLALLAGCELLCSFAQNKRCGMFFACLVQAVQCMAAATALYFGIALFGTVLMFTVGGG